MHNFIPYSSRNASTAKPSNRTLLQVAASTFLLFMIAEVVGALRSNSLSLLGDAIAMSVDVFTYFTNLYAEGTKDGVSSRNIFNRIVNEIGIPSFSVVCLLGVTVYITLDAVKVLENPPTVNDVPVSYLYGFAILNLVIDTLCGAIFYVRGKEVFYEPIVPIPMLSLEISLDSEEEEREFGHLEEDLDLTLSGHSVGMNNRHGAQGGAGGEGSMRKNLNMLSAFTHVGGDTVRTISVIAAATVSSVFEIDADICDAWAAVAVAVTVALITLPLIIDIIAAARNIFDDRSGGGDYSPVPRFSGDKDNDSTIGVGVLF